MKVIALHETHTELMASEFLDLIHRNCLLLKPLHLEMKTLNCSYLSSIQVLKKIGCRIAFLVLFFAVEPHGDRLMH
jgi:hypothetical protein